MSIIDFYLLIQTFPFHSLRLKIIFLFNLTYISFFCVFDNACRVIMKFVLEVGCRSVGMDSKKFIMQSGMYRTLRRLNYAFCPFFFSAPLLEAGKTPGKPSTTYTSCQRGKLQKFVVNILL